MSEWVFTDEELSESPSRKDGLSLEEEKECHLKTCTFIEEVTEKLNVSRLTMATAQVFFHRFFVRQSFKAHDRFLVASACIFLASKVEEIPRPLKNVVGAYLKLRKGVEMDLKSPEFIKTKEKIVDIERILLHTVAFDLMVEHPYPFISKWVSDVLQKLPSGSSAQEKETKRKRLMQFAWNFVNDNLRTMACLRFEPKDMAAAAVYLACVYDKALADTDRWWEVFELPNAVLNAICQENMQPYLANLDRIKDERLVQLLEMYPTSKRLTPKIECPE